MVENGRQEVPRWPPTINRKLNKVTLFPHLTRTKFLRNSYSTYFDEICAKEKLDLIGVENFYIPYEWKLNVCILVLERLENFHWFFYRKKMDKNLTEVEIDRFWEFLNSRIVKIWLEFLLWRRILFRERMDEKIQRLHVSRKLMICRPYYSLEVANNSGGG